MTVPADIAAKLNQPLSPSRIHKREGSGGKSLDYLATHDVIRAANAIFGFGGWGHEVLELRELGLEPVKSKTGKEGFRVGYRCTVRVTVDGCQPTSGVGYGDAQEYNGSSITPHELAAKEAESDALKRALKNFGDQFGLVLYAKPGEERNRVAAQAAKRAAVPEADHQQAGAGTVAEPPAVTSTPASSASETASFVAPTGKNPSDKALNALVGKMLSDGKITRAQLYKACDVEVPAEPSWAALRPTLDVPTRVSLYERLKRYEQNAKAAA